MSRKLASVQKIGKLEPIEGKDRIELATIQGWKVIVGKDDFKVGDLVVYIQYDTILPVTADFEFLGARCYSKKYNGFRIRNMKMGNVFSEGIVFPLKILPKSGASMYIEGYDASDILGVQKYDIEGMTAKIGYPTEITRADEANIQVAYSILKDKSYLYYLSEKLEGQAACYYVNSAGEFKVYSHNLCLGERSDNNWWNIAIKFDIEKKMKGYMKNHKVKSMSLMGEIVGPKIQKNIYGLSSLDFYVYSIEDIIAKNKFGFKDLYEVFHEETGLKIVPLIAKETKLPDSVNTILESCVGESLLKKGVKREGIVWRRMDGGKGFKAKSKEYQAWWYKRDVTI